VEKSKIRFREEGGRSKEHSWRPPKDGEKNGGSKIIQLLNIYIFQKNKRAGRAGEG